MPLTVCLTPLPLLKRHGESLLRCIRIAVTADPVQGGDHCVLEIRQAGTSREIDLGDLLPGRNEKTIMVPEPPGDMTAVVRYGEQRWTDAIRLLPARRWTVHLVLHSHTDLGFTDPISTVARIHTENTDRAIELCRETASLPEGMRFKWTCEVGWQVQQYIAARAPERVETLMKLVREGSIAVGALYAGELTDILGHEEAVRSFYYASHLRRHYGIPCDTAMLCDVPGCTEGFVQIMAKAGIRNFILADNNFIAPVLARTDLPRPFWWNGADGTRVLCWYTDHPFYAYVEGEYYGFTQNVLSVAEKLPEKLMALEAAGYPFDRLQLQYAFDNAVLDTRPAEIVREWNSIWEYPKVVLSTAREFMAHLRKAHAEHIPARAGDWTDWWAGISTGFPSEAALTRTCHERVPAAELFWTGAVLLNPSLDYPSADIAGVYDGLLAFDEHSGGGTLWKPQSPEEQQQAVTEGFGFVHGAAATLDRLECEVSAALGAMIGSATGSDLVAVLNPTGLVRSGVVECSATGEKTPVVVVDQTTGKTIQAVRLLDNRVAFRSPDVPQYGYRVYRLVPAAASPGIPPMKATARAEQNEIVLENRFYRLAINRRTGLCTSLYAAGAQRECVSSRASVNQALVYVSHPVKKIELGKYIPEIYRGDENPGETIPWPASSRAVVEWSEHPILGPSCRVSHTLEGLIWLTQEYRLPHEDAGVCMRNTLSRAVRDDQRLAGALAGFLGNEGMLYFAFAFDIPGGEFEYESPAGVLRPSKMQFKGSCHDFFAVQRWCRIASPEISIAVASPDAPLVDVGSIGLLKFKPELDRDQSTLYIRGVSLREWGDSSESPYSKGEDLVFRFGIDVTALQGKGGDDATAGRSQAHAFGLAMHVPLRAITVSPGAPGPTSHSWCSIAPANIELMTLKKEEDGKGVIVRIREVLGEPADARIAFPGFRIAAAQTAMVTEEPLENAEVRDNAIHARLAPLAIQTFLVTLAGEGSNGRVA